MTEPRWLNPTEDRAWRSHIKVAGLVSAQIGRDLANDCGLTIIEYHVLAALSETPAGRLRMGELAASLLWSPSRTAHQVGRMEKRELVRRAADSADARGAVAQITPSGLDVLQRAAPGHVASVRRHIFDHLSGRQVAALADIYETLLPYLTLDTPPARGMS